MGDRSSSDLVTAPAKLTLRLEVTGVRADGYHELDAEMVTLDFGDTLEIRPPGQGDGGLEVVDAVEWVGAAPEPASAVPAPAPAPSPAWAPARAPSPPSSPSPSPSPSPAPLDASLVVRALEAVGRRAGVRLTKRVPAGAGLGGGSADAAAVLRWAGESSLQVAAGLGADVPFCLTGGRARVSGIGEVVSPLPVRQLGDVCYLLVVPRVHVSTPAVYQAWDELGGPVGDHGNDLEPAALAVAPQLRWWRDLLGAASGQRPRLAGSGGTWFVEFRGADGSRTDGGSRTAGGSGDPDGSGGPDLGRADELAGELRAEIVAAREPAVVRVARPVSY